MKYIDILWNMIHAPSDSPHRNPRNSFRTLPFAAWNVLSLLPSTLIDHNWPWELVKSPAARHKIQWNSTPPADSSVWVDPSPNLAAELASTHGFLRNESWNLRRHNTGLKNSKDKISHKHQEMKGETVFRVWRLQSQSTSGQSYSNSI